MHSQPIVYTFVSQFQVPRANWTQYSESTEKSFLPIAERLVADGTLLSYSTFENLVHTPDGYTHGAAWSSSSIAGLMKTLEEIRKAGPQSAQFTATKHEDYLMQSSMYLVGGGKPEYVRVVCLNAKPDKPEGFAAAIRKYLWPMAEEQAKKGAVSYVGFDTQYVHTGGPSMQCLVMDYPSAESMDQWATAVNATFGKMSASDTEEFYGSSVADSRRDLLARVTHSGHRSK